MNKLVLVLNCVSSSIKFVLFDIGHAEIPRKPRWNGEVDGILSPDPSYGDSLTKPYQVELGSEHP